MKIHLCLHLPYPSFGSCGAWYFSPLCQVSGFQSTPLATGPGSPATTEDMAQSTYFAAVGLNLSAVCVTQH